MSEQEPRNAAAGARQRQYLKKEHQDTGRAFAHAGLTRKNEDFMYQLNKQLDAQGVKASDKPAMLAETIAALKEGQKSGRTAKAMFKTPTEHAHELLHPKPTEQEQQQTASWLMAIDNGLMFFAIFTFMFGLMALISPATMRLAHNGSSGITAIVAVAISGGLVFGYVNRILLPAKDAKSGKAKRRPLWQRLLLILAALAVWILVYTLVAMLPNGVNPRLNQYVYLTLGVLGFLGDLYFRRRFHVTGGFFGAPAPRRDHK